MSILRDAVIVDVIKNGAKTPLQVIVDVMNGDTSYSQLQLKAAELAAPYMHPRLVAVKAKTEITGADGKPLTLGAVADPVEAAKIYAQIMGQQVTIEHEALEEGDG